MIVVERSGFGANADAELQQDNAMIQVMVTADDVAPIFLCFLLPSPLLIVLAGIYC